MPEPSALFLSLITSAILGGLLLHLLRRPHLRPLPQTIWLRGDDFVSALKPPDSPMSASAEPRPSSANLSPPPAAGELILLVDDEAGIRNVLSTVLLNHGYEVITARDGAEGVEQFRAYQDKIALVITDINMPKENGRTLVEFIRPLRPGIRVLFMSGLEAHEPESGTRGQSSSDPFLLKPFKPTALLNTIHQVLHPAAPPA